MMAGWGMGYGMGGWGFLWGLLWFGLVIWGVYTLVKIAGQGGFQGTGGRDAALELLRKRYARGELDQETYERMKRDLEA